MDTMNWEDTYVTDVQSFLGWVKQTRTVEVNENENSCFSLEEDFVYYRGQSCLCWDLKPSILREEQPLSPLHDEHFLMNEASRKLWNETSNLNNYLEKMIFFQHYGLPTRLLDVTFNPLIALFMACDGEKEQEKDGVVYCGYSHEQQNTKIADFTAKYIFEHRLQYHDVAFGKLAEKEKFNIEDFTEPLFILPPISNPRLETQNGGFIMSPLFEKVVDDKTALKNLKGLEKSNFFDKRRAIVSSDVKKDLLHELSSLGVDLGTIYKGIEYRLKAILANETWSINRSQRIETM